MSSKYKGALREYTVVGISAVFRAIISKEFSDFFGGKGLSKILFVAREDGFWHFQSEEEVCGLADAFLSRVERKELDLEAVYRDLDARVTRLESIYAKTKADYNFDLILGFYEVYTSLIPFAYAIAYSGDRLEAVTQDAATRQEYLNWLTKARLRAENIYKQGEMFFIPAYMTWLSKKLSRAYTPELLQYLMHTELVHLAKNEGVLPTVAELQARKTLMYASFSSTGEEYLTGTAAAHRIQELGLFEEGSVDTQNVTHFKGQTAYGGRATGKVRCIFKRADLETFVEGEIIVSPMTDPSYLSVMKRAKAFITDEGGILCHAAIVARELQKPCIIGTKIATKVLKDGDEVEVDAEKGMVRILNKAS